MYIYIYIYTVYTYVYMYIASPQKTEMSILTEIVMLHIESLFYLFGNDTYT